MSLQIFIYLFFRFGTVQVIQGIKYSTRMKSIPTNLCGLGVVFWFFAFFACGSNRFCSLFLSHFFTHAPTLARHCFQLIVLIKRHSCDMPGTQKERRLTLPIGLNSVH